MGLQLTIALLAILIMFFFAPNDPETRERLLLVGGIIVLVAVTAYVLMSGVQSSSGELNDVLGGTTGTLSSTVRDIADKISVGE